MPEIENPKDPYFEVGTKSEGLVLTGDEKVSIAEAYLDLARELLGPAGRPDISMGEDFVRLRLTVRSTGETRRKAMEHARELLGKGFFGMVNRAIDFVFGATEEEKEEGLARVAELVEPGIKSQMLLAATKRITDGDMEVTALLDRVSSIVAGKRASGMAPC